MRSTLLPGLALLLAGACSSVAPPETLLTPAEGEVLLAGSILSIEDAVPVDGGVTVVLRDAGGREYTAYLPSMFRLPPAPESDWALYQILRELKPGQKVVLTGPMTELGLRITAIQTQ